MPPPAGQAPCSQGNASASSPRAFRRATILGVATPLLLLPCTYSFITFGATASCLRQYGSEGACDPLHPVAIAATVGQVAIAIAVIALLTLARTRRRPRIGIIYLAITCSIELAVVTSIIAGSWMTGPG